VGGHAVGIHSEPRGTKDLDIFIKADRHNSHAVFAALGEYGAPIAGMTPEDFNDKPTSIFQMGVPPRRVDILQGIAGVDFDEAWEKRVEEVLGGDVRAHVISRDISSRTSSQWDACRTSPTWKRSAKPLCSIKNL